MFFSDCDECVLLDFERPTCGSYSKPFYTLLRKFRKRLSAVSFIVFLLCVRSALLYLHIIIISIVVQIIKLVMADTCNMYMYLNSNVILIYIFQSCGIGSAKWFVQILKLWSGLGQYWCKSYICATATCMDYVTILIW